MKLVSESLIETEKIAKDFILNLKQGDKASVVGLYGNLGSGKTTFTQLVSKILGIQETVTSPTFVIMKIYNLENKKWKFLVHIDAYRLEKSEELLHLGWEEIISDKNNIVLIEWPEKVSDIMPVHNKIRFETLEGEGKRQIEISNA